LRLLLDTHVLLWWLADDPGLSGNARALIASAESEVLVSAASAWEISIKRALGKLDAPDDLEAQLVQHHFSPLAISVGHALAAGALPRHHEDPFDSGQIELFHRLAPSPRPSARSHFWRATLVGVTTSPFSARELVGQLDVPDLDT